MSLRNNDSHDILNCTASGYYVFAVSLPSSIMNCEYASRSALARWQVSTTDPTRGPMITLVIMDVKHQAIRFVDHSRSEKKIFSSLSNNDEM